MARVVWHNAVAIPLSLMRMNLTPTALRLWIVLASHANAEKVSWPSIKRLLSLMPEGTTRRTLQRARLELEERLLLETFSCHDDASGRQTSNAYTLLAPEDEVWTAEDGADVREGVKNVTGEGDRHVAVEGDVGTAPRTYPEELSQKELLLYSRSKGFTVPPAFFERWKTAFSGVDVADELVKATAWAAANPPKKNWHRFLVNWMMRARRDAPKPASAPLKIRPAILDLPPLTDEQAAENQRRAKEMVATAMRRLPGVTP